MPGLPKRSSTARGRVSARRGARSAATRATRAGRASTKSCPSPTKCDSSSCATARRPTSLGVTSLEEIEAVTNAQRDSRLRPGSAQSSATLSARSTSFNNHRSKEFVFFGHGADFTDEAVCTIAVADALLHGRDPAKTLHEWVQPLSIGCVWWDVAGWLSTGDRRQYNSFGNSAAMRVSPAAESSSC